MSASPVRTMENAFHRVDSEMDSRLTPLSVADAVLLTRIAAWQHAVVALGTIELYGIAHDG